MEQRKNPVTEVGLAQALLSNPINGQEIIFELILRKFNDCSTLPSTKVLGSDIIKNSVNIPEVNESNVQEVITQIIKSLDSKRWARKYRILVDATLETGRNLMINPTVCFTCKETFQIFHENWDKGKIPFVSKSLPEEKELEAWYNLS